MTAVVNDVHSQLNETEIAGIVPVDSLESLRRAISSAGSTAAPLSVAGGWHSMGGQQFVTAGTLVDTRPMSRVLELDREGGLVEVESGIQWPALVNKLIELQAAGGREWAIRQKQTGADAFTIGGSVSANCHGRGLAMPPIASDVESLRLVTGDSSVLTCSRTEHPELFALVLGGYGLFGAIYSVTLRLARRVKLERVVDLSTVDRLVEAFEDRIAERFLYGDFQFAIDSRSPDFLSRGVFSCYRPVEDERPVPEAQNALTTENWQLLLGLAHTDKTRAFEEYSRYYLRTSGQIYWSDLHQLSDYVGGYHTELDRLLGAEAKATEMITELYVPRGRLADFMAAAAEALRGNGGDVIYGTIRLIERDPDTFLAWARSDFACVIFNLHTVHTPEGIATAANAFRELIDLAVERGGSFFLTYHRWASVEQVTACYPQFPAFLTAKSRYDPGGRFQSDWYRHHALLFGEEV
jgi:FAD/FMN-containing dehydrogenase